MPSPEPESASSVANPPVALAVLGGWRRLAAWPGALDALWPYALFTLVFVGYWLVGDLYLNVPGEIHIFRIEFPLALYLFFAAMHLLRPSRWRPWLALTGVFAPYAVHDLYWYFFNDIPEIVALKELPELFIAGDWTLQAAILAAAAAFCYVVATQVRYRWSNLIVLLPGLVVLTVLALAPERIKTAIEWGAVWINPWIKADNAALNGRFTIALYNESKRRIARRALATYADNPARKADDDALVAYLKSRALDDRPVFLVVLESFLDARALKPLRERNDILDPEFLRLYGKYWGYSVSPTFGGATARAEMELLCGIPSLREFDNVEFNLFSGRRVACLPQILARIGYDTLASDPYIPSFFNAQRAYPGMGFKEVYFAQELGDRASYLHVRSREQYLFDGDLYRQHRAFLEQRDGGQRFFSYLLTTYGHLPFEVQMPLRIKVKTKEKALERVVNQSYYRSAALAEQIQWIVKRYPRSLIVAVADHLPVLRAGPDTYLKMGYMNNVAEAIYYNRLLVVRDGKPKKYPTLHHFSIPDLIYDYLTDGAYCRDYACALPYPYDKERLRERYRYLLGNAVLDPE